MKNLTKRVKQASLIVTIAVIAALTFSCAPEVEISDFDWNAANAANDPTQNSGTTNATNFAPGASLVKTVKGTGADADTITEVYVNVNFTGSATKADVLRNINITAASLDFITFHSFTKAETEYTEDKLSAAIPFAVESRQGNTVSVKLTTTIDTTAAFSNIIMRIDGKKYTYDHGLRLDVDSNGKIEAVYDDWFTREITIAGSTITPAYVGPGQRTTWFLGLPTNISSRISTQPATTAAPTNPNVFYFIGDAKTTNANLLIIDYIGTVSSTTTDADKAYFKDIGDTFAKGLKLQKLNGTKWTDVKTAEFDTTIRNATLAEAAAGNTYIVIKDVTFEHLATYRLIWTGSAYTETSGTYYGVKQRLYVQSGATNAARYKVTEFVTTPITAVNSSVAQFVTPSNFTSGGVSLEMTSFDSENKNNVLKIAINDNDPYRFYWNSVSLDAFKKSFQIVYASPSGTPSNTAPNLVYVGIKDIKFAAEDWAETLGNNVLYITLDPAYKSNNTAAFNAYQKYLTDYAAWQKANQAYTTAYAAWQAQLLAYQQAQTAAGNQYDADLSTWEWGRDTWLSDNDDGDPDTPALTEDDYIAAGNPKPVRQGYLDQAAIDTPYPGPYSGPASVGPAPTTVAQSQLGIYLRINNGISVTDKKSPETVQYFGNENPLYDNFDFYGPL